MTPGASNTMNIFISWSGAKSREVATALRQWIPALLPSSEPWIASDLPAGSDWSREITHRLQQARSGIICLTADNRDSPWLLFEAGALARSGRLYLYLVDFEPVELAGPFAQFQATRANKDGTWRLISALNNTTEGQVPEDVLRPQFDERWPQLQRTLAAAAAPRVETVSLVFADIVGSTRLFATAGDLNVQKTFGEFFARASELVRIHKGLTTKFLGDGFLAAFATPNEALLFATELQRSLLEKPLQIGGLPLAARMGVHCGVVHLTPEKDITGTAINLAARITSMADPGQVVVSGDAYAQLPSEPKRLLSPLEQVEVKGFAEQVEISRYSPTRGR
jgi:class 3 adenylate cyclase